MELDQDYDKTIKSGVRFLVNKLPILLLSATVITSLSGLIALPARANQFIQAFCEGYLKGAAITGDYSSVPDDCRQYMQPPSSSQRSNRRDSDSYVEQQERRNRQIHRDADINLESIQDSNCLASSDGC
jgi:hypothetical protein